MAPTPETLTTTRLALQAVAEHVLSAARHQATGRIGLRAYPGGFATPPFPTSAGERTIAVSDTKLLVTDDGGTREAPLTTVAAAATFVGIGPGAPTNVYTPTTALEPEVSLIIDRKAAAALASWWALVDDALRSLRTELAAEEPTEVQLWPEHFDLACSIGEVNYGGSAGDADHEEPYLYVGPWSPPEPDGGFWNRPFGALRPASDVAHARAALEFFHEGRRRLAR